MELRRYEDEPDTQRVQKHQSWAGRGDGTMPSFVPFHFRFLWLPSVLAVGVTALRDSAGQAFAVLKAKNHTLKFPSRRTVLLAD